MAVTALAKGQTGARRDTTWMLSRAGLLVALPAIVTTLIVGGVLGASAVALVVVVIGFLLGIACAGVIVVPAWRLAEARIARHFGLRPADPITQARLFNLVEGLCTAAGLARPRLHIARSDSLNALVFGRDTRHGHLAVTQRMLEDVSRIELEGVVAHLLCRLRDRITTAPTVACGLALGPLGGHMVGAAAGTVTPAVLELMDQRAVTLTRYPPGLLSALEHVRADLADASVAGGPKPTASLWLSPPDGQAAASDLDDRIEALGEL